MTGVTTYVQHATAFQLVVRLGFHRNSKVETSTNPERALETQKWR